MVWFQLVSRSGEPLGSPDAVEVSSDENVRDFQKTLKDYKASKSDGLLGGVLPRDLKVYKDWEAYEDANVAPLKLWIKLVGYGMRDNPLIVEVPKIWFQLVDAKTGAALAERDSVPLSEDMNVQSLKIEIREMSSCSCLEGIGPRGLKVYKNREAYDDPQQAPLMPSAALVGCGVTEELALVVVVPQLVKIPTFLERSAEPLLSTMGSHWDFQKPSNLEAMTQAIPKHFDAWKKGYTDKRCHPLFLCAGGPGTGKSRILNEFPGLVKDFLKNHENKEMVGMLESAYTFNLTFENGPAEECFTKASLLLGTRMLYQLQDSLSWDTFCENPVYHAPPNRALDILCDLVNASHCWLIAIVSAMNDTLPEYFYQWHIYFEPPKLSCPTVQNKDIFQEFQDDALVQLLVDDMGGFGRCLEELYKVMIRLGSRGQFDFEQVLKEVVKALHEAYPEVRSRVDSMREAFLAAVARRVARSTTAKS